MDFQILSDNSNGPQTRSVWALLKNGAQIRKVEVILKNEEAAEASLLAQGSSLWAQGEAAAESDWLSAQHKASNAMFDKLIFALIQQLQAGADLPTLLAVGNIVLADDPFQKDLYQRLGQALQGANDGQVRQFVALALTITLGKLGQR